MNDYTLQKNYEHRARDLQQSRAQHNLAQQVPAPPRPRSIATFAQVISFVLGLIR